MKRIFLFALLFTTWFLIIAATLNTHWSEPIDLSADGFDGTDISCDINNVGEAVVLWNRAGGGESYAIETCFFSGNTWHTQEQLSPIGKDAVLGDVAIDDGGNAIAAWTIKEGDNLIIQASTYSQGTWSHPLSLSPSNGSSLYPCVVMTPSGKGLLTWKQFDSKHDTHIIYASFYTNGSFSTPQSISDHQFNAMNPRCALSDTGEAIAVWIKDTSEGDVLQAAIYSNGAWKAPETLSSNTINAASPNVVMNNHGVGMVIWEQLDDLHFFIHTLLYSKESWGSEHVISGAAAYMSQVALSDTGDAVAIWMQTEGIENGIQSATYLGGSDLWSLPVVMATGKAVVSEPKVAINGNGFAIANWLEAGVVQVSELVSLKDNTWGTPTPISSIGQTAVDQRIEMNDQGAVLALWGLFNGARWIVQSSSGTS